MPASAGPPGTEDASQWRTRAAQRCAVLLHAAALEDRSMATVCAWAHAQRAYAFCQKAESSAPWRSSRGCRAPLGPELAWVSAGCELRFGHNESGL
jgi:hypothetical protein